MRLYSSAFGIRFMLQYAEEEMWYQHGSKFKYASKMCELVVYWK